MKGSPQTGVKPIFELGLAIAALTAAYVVQATTVIRLNLSRLVDQADLIFVGKSISQEVVPTRDGKFPFTFVTFSVEQVLKGSTKDRSLTLRLVGGQIGKRTIEVVGMPEFQRDERYLLFVTQNGKAGCPLLGWSQGVMHFTRDSQTSEAIMTDAWGAPILGIRGDDWLRGAPKLAPEPGVVYSEPSTSQVHGEDEAGRSGTAAPVKESIATKQAGTPEPVDADRLLAELRAFIARRRAKPGFHLAAPVRSALPSEVPESMRGAFLPPEPATKVPRERPEM
jgi:hypothetical protein